MFLKWVLTAEVSAIEIEFDIGTSVTLSSYTAGSFISLPGW